MRIKQKRAFTLLETLIALSILSVLLTMVFAFFREITQMSAITEQLQNESFRMRYTEMRLAYLFERIVNENEKTTREFFFFSDKPGKGVLTDTPALVFSFDNEARANPTFSGDLLARVYVDPEHRLSLAMWPISGADPHQEMHKEILLENVTGLVLEFYMPPGQEDKQPDKEQKKEPERDKWQSEWLSAYEQMPAIIRLTVNIADDPKELKKGGNPSQIKSTPRLFSFVLPSSKNTIYYPAES
ncbi:MAG: prepilin-type N-terminal cleavage/methylation domain-containing protein [Parachlamydia sp.]|jgi:prepilin-type N-terminal cleavage/methylation domain-containing protein|nr:prepilin-type N-terminal cleavage/methylation domain-containing protein [Parachlamydia sp.]